MRAYFVLPVALSLAGCGALKLQVNGEVGSATPAASSSATTSSASPSSPESKGADSAASVPSKLAALKRFAVPADLQEVALFEGESHGSQDADFVLVLPATIPELHLRVVGVADGRLTFTPVVRYLSDGRSDAGGATVANAAGEQVVRVRTTSPAGTPFTVIAAVDRVSKYDAYRVFGKPMPKATVAARDVGLFWSHQGRQQTVLAPYGVNDPVGSPPLSAQDPPAATSVSTVIPPGGVPRIDVHAEVSG
jgi:hypothetical protein